MIYHKNFDGKDEIMQSEKQEIMYNKYNKHTLSLNFLFLLIFKTTVRKYKMTKNIFSTSKL